MLKYKHRAIVCRLLYDRYSRNQESVSGCECPSAQLLAECRRLGWLSHQSHHGFDAAHFEKYSRDDQTRILARMVALRNARLSNENLEADAVPLPAPLIPLEEARRQLET
jgi:hypothetical protein